MHSLTRVARVALVVIWVLTFGAAYWIFLNAPGVGTFHDDGIYLVTAKALAEGQGYRIISIPGEPAQNKYPVLFPFLLSLGWRAHPTFPDNLIWLRLVPLACAGAWFAVAWSLLRRLGTSRAIATAMLLVAAASPWVVFLSTALLAETLFAALLTAGVLFLTRIYQHEGRRYDGFVAGLLMGLALLTRAAGVAPVGGGALALLLMRNWRSLTHFSAGVLLVALPWFWWVATHQPQPGIEAFYSASTYREWNIITHFTWSQKIDVLTVNGLYAAAFGQFWGISSPWWLKLVSAVICSALIVRGLWLAPRSPLSLVVILNFAMVVVFVWPPVRYIVPVIPLLIWLAYVGAGKYQKLTTAIALVFLITAGVELSHLGDAVRTKGSTAFSTTEAWIFDWPPIQRQTEWIKANTPPDSILTTILDPAFYLFTGRQALRPFSFDQFGMHYNLHGGTFDPFGTSEDLRQRIIKAGVDYVVVTPRDQLQLFVDELSQFYPGSFTIVDGALSSGSLIYRVETAELERSPISDQHRDR